MSGILKEMARSSLERLSQARAVEPEKSLWHRASDAAPPPPLKLNTAGFDVIAELKLRSPAKGVLRAATEDIAARVTSYAQGGAAAVSVLTEPYHFDGSMAHLARASETLAPLGVPTRASTPAPSLIGSASRGAGRAILLTLQGVIADPGSAGSRPASVTNAITIEVR